MSSGASNIFMETMHLRSLHFGAGQGKADHRKFGPNMARNNNESH